MSDEKKGQANSDVENHAPEDRSAEEGEASKDNIEADAFKDAEKLHSGESAGKH